jgi:hypothetical protein
MGSLSVVQNSFTNPLLKTGDNISLSIDPSTLEITKRGWTIVNLTW